MRIRIMILLVLGCTATIAAGQDTTISGFVDGAYFYDTSERNGEFGADQVEVDVIHQASETTMLRADLEWVKDGEATVAQVEQAFMTVALAHGVDFTLGKFNAPIGFELLDAPDMYQYSHGLVFDYGIPTNLTGVSLAKDLGHGLDAILHVSNGWDRQTADANVTVGGRIGFTRGDFAGGFSAISGREEFAPVSTGDPALAFTRTVFDIDASYTVSNWIFGGEFNVGDVQLPADAEASWTGVLLMGHVDFTDRAGFTARYDWFDDGDGFVFGPIGVENQTRQAITLAPTLTLDDGFGALVELRMDISDQDAFVDGDGEATDTSTSVAFEMTYVW